MKKTYAKPEIMFEDFSLSTHIASDCEFYPGHPDLDFGGVGFVFLENICEFEVTEVGGLEDGTDGWNKICYHVFADDRTIFTSY